MLSLISAATSSVSPPATTLTPLSLSSIPLLSTAPLGTPNLTLPASSLLPTSSLLGLLSSAPLGTPNLTLPASSLLPTSSLPGTVCCTSNQSQPLPSFLLNYPPLSASKQLYPNPGKTDLADPGT